MFLPFSTLFRSNVGVALSTKSMDIAWLAITVTDTTLEATPLPEAVAVLVIEPASMSGWVIVYGDEEQGVEAPGASGPLAHETAPTILLSFTVNGPAMVVFPLLVIV